MSRSSKRGRRKTIRITRRRKGSRRQAGGLSCGDVFRLKTRRGDDIRNLTRAQSIKYRLCKHALSRNKYDRVFPGYRKKTAANRVGIKTQRGDNFEKTFDNLKKVVSVVGTKQQLKTLENVLRDKDYKVNVSEGRQILTIARQNNMTLAPTASRMLKTGESHNEINTRLSAQRGRATSTPKKGWFSAMFGRK